MHCSKLEIVNGFHWKYVLLCRYDTIYGFLFYVLHLSIQQVMRSFASIIQNKLKRTNNDTGTKKPKHLLRLHPIIFLWNMVYVGMFSCLTNDQYTDRMQYEHLHISHANIQHCNDLFVFRLQVFSTFHHQKSYDGMWYVAGFACECKFFFISETDWDLEVHHN